MMVQRKRLTLSDFQKASNVPGTLSKILSYEVPRGRAIAILSEPARIKLTAKEIISAVNIDTSPKAINVSFTPANSAQPAQQGIAFIGSNKYTFAKIDPVNKQIFVEGATGVTGDMEIYYAIGEGTYQIVVEVPSGSSTKKLTIDAGSLSQLNSRDLYDEGSLIILPDGVIGPEMELQVYVETNAQIDLGNEKAVIDIPVVVMDEEGLMAALGLTFDMVEASYQGG